MFVLVTNSHPSVTRPLARLYPPDARTQPRPYSQKKRNYPFATRTCLRSYSSVDGSEKILLDCGRVRAMAPTRPLLASSCARTFFLSELEAAYMLLPVRGLRPASLSRLAIIRASLAN